ncbi:hypothetical protein AYI70_g11655 [Smittium culicis]|uniref:Uncharacterized protein n=1 Tax=Smittium culicis TaxID=133412 RepID=A0A1R1X0V0_9FUNG|nr:hypothetical protein AYI70_g11655 [Smittium culicis]
MGSQARDLNERLSGRPPGNGVVTRRMFKIDSVCFEKTGSTRDMPIGHLNLVKNEILRCVIEDDYPDRMLDFPNRLQGNTDPVRKQRNISICVSKKNAAGEIFQLVPR